mmetsp:Transcript_32852/g.98929  ORF Transcript_32852/g.98929 Transcript_32852/m.98929 type:complete len:450 (+) Transcript_32852:131-1480(+)
MIHPPLLRLARRGRGVHGVVDRDALRLRRAEHGQDRQRELGDGQVRSPALAEQVEADVPVRVDVRVSRRRLQEIARRRRRRIVGGELHAQLVLLALEDRLVGAGHRHDPDVHVLPHAHAAPVRRRVDEVLELARDANLHALLGRQPLRRAALRLGGRRLFLRRRRRVPLVLRVAEPDEPLREAQRRLDDVDQLVLETRAAAEEQSALRLGLELGAAREPQRDRSQPSRWSQRSARREHAQQRRNGAAAAHGRTASSSSSRAALAPERRGEIGCGDAADRVSRLARRQTALSASFAAKSKVPQLSTRSNQAPSASRAHFATPAAQSQQRAQPRASSRERRRPSAARGRRVRWRDVSARSAKTSARPIRRTRDGRRLRHLPRKRRVRGAPVLRRRRPGRLDDAFLPRVPPPARRPRRRRGAMPAVPRLDLRRERRGHAARRRRRVSGLQAG